MEKEKTLEQKLAAAREAAISYQKKKRSLPVRATIICLWLGLALYIAYSLATSIPQFLELSLVFVVILSFYCWIALQFAYHLTPVKEVSEEDIRRFFQEEK